MWIRAYDGADWPGVWEILEPVFREGESYMVDPEISEAEAQRIWTGHSGRVYVAEDEGGDILGTYYLKANHPGPGDHLCNAGFAVHPEARGRGIARTMGRHALEEARKVGFEAMQFNAVVSCNTAAVRLWHSLGFRIDGEVPEAFRSRKHGRVSIYVMHRPL
jgi:GNAT superfamily N-acetyltransferase